MLTPQEEFWSGTFGNEYGRRNRVDWAIRVPFWNWVLNFTRARSILDVGCNSGWNMRAIRNIDPMCALWGCDINADALEEASKAGLSVENTSLFDLSKWPGGFDLVVTSGVLIHVAPADIERAMVSISSASNKYVLAVEYDAPKETEIEYRGHADRLWKRPFGKMYADLGLKLVADGDAPGFDRCAFWLLRRK